MKTYISILLILIIVVFTACSNGNDHLTKTPALEKNQHQAGERMDFQGIIVEKNNSGVIVIVGLTEKEVKGRTTNEIISQYEPKAYDVSTRNIKENLEVGDHVKVWTNGMYEDSRIRRTTATKIEIVR
ncbi:DUF3221 domain-containing protein [Paenibacillus sp. XY044]|uniref:DUF3221 domain-containing protein n=1 Tax=Paenibacillus sp. XY044 TaxID=2026089 RepID=UPI0015C6746E|nr:DUF3221 domain-containing protein [Paenibacillus sp. XY044]